MIMSRQASRLAGHSGSVPPLRWLRCRASHGRQPDSRREPAGLEGTAR
jgi:hypothetical protein